MVRCGGRSKGCANCRRLKKKCDEAVPQCGLCTASGRECAGPVTGPVFINADASAMAKQRKRLKSSETLVATPCNLLAEKRAAASAYQIQAVANLVHYCSQAGGANSGRTSWLLMLPEILVTMPTAATRASLLAPSLMLLSMRSRRTEVFRESLVWYGQALGCIRNRLATSRTLSDPEFRALLYATMTLAFFETFNSTLAGGYVHHVCGAASLLQARGAAICAEPEYRDVFRAVRSHMIYVSLVTRTQSVFASEPWLSIPLQQSRDAYSERIKGILLRLPKYLAVLEENRRHTTSRSELLQDLGIFLGELDEIWPHISPLELRRSVTASAPREHAHTGHIGDVYFTYKDAFSAYSIALLQFARLLVVLIVSRLSPSCAQDIRDMARSSASILSAAAFIKASGVGCGCVQLVLPVQLVAQESPLSRQRKLAIDLLRSWCENSPIKGLTREALDAIYHDRRLVPLQATIQ